LATESRNGLIKMKQLSQASNLPVSTIKFYMLRGLLPLPRKEKRNVAYYDSAFLGRLMVIKKMRSEGVSIRSIKEILEKHSFNDIADWEDFRRRARGKGSHELASEERLAAMSDEERRSQQIREAAFRVFSRKGYHNATMDDIASEAGVSKGTCYQYFSGKEEVFIATMEDAVERVLSQGGLAAADAKDDLEKLAKKGLAFISQHQNLHFMMMGVISEALAGNRELKAKASEFFERAALFLAKDIENGIELGVFRPVDPVAVAYALMGIAEIAGNLSIVRKDFNTLDFLGNLVDFLSYGLSAVPIP